MDRVISLVFLIGPGLGGAAGLMVGIYYGQIDFTMGWSYGLKAFTAAILGGIGNIPGAMLGGLLLGVGKGLLLVCLAPDIQPEDVEQMAEYAPAKAVISRDSFADDTAMANAWYILRDRGVDLKLV